MEEAHARMQDRLERLEIVIDKHMPACEAKIEKLERNAGEQEKQNNGLREMLDAWESRRSKQHADVLSWQQEVSRIVTSNQTDPTNNVKDLRVDITQLRDTVSALSEPVGPLQNRVIGMQATYASVTSDITSLRAEVAIRANLSSLKATDDHVSEQAARVNNIYDAKLDRSEASQFVSLAAYRADLDKLWDHHTVPSIKLNSVITEVKLLNTQASDLSDVLSASQKELLQRFSNLEDSVKTHFNEASNFKAATQKEVLSLRAQANEIIRVQQQHSKALTAHGLLLDSCSREA